MNISDNVTTTTPSVSLIVPTGRAGPESPEDEEKSGLRSQQEDVDVKPFYFAGAFSCIIVVTLIGATLAILLTNKPTVKDAAPKNSFVLKFIGENPEGPLARCEGNCDTDEDCFPEFVCFQREEEDGVPGCGGNLTSHTADYCIRPEDIPSAEPEPPDSPSVRPSTWFSVRSFSPSIGPTPALPAKLTLLPFKHRPSFSPSIELTPAPTANLILLNWIDINPEALLARCEGNCDTDADCFPELVCFLRSSAESVPGCGGNPYYKIDYCIRPEDIPSV